MGFFQSCGAASRAIAPFFMGEAYDVWYKLPFIVGGIMGILAGVALIFVPYKKQEYQPVPEEVSLQEEDNIQDESNTVELQEVVEKTPSNSDNQSTSTES